jgi:hypothetical protein
MEFPKEPATFIEWNDSTLENYNKLYSEFLEYYKCEYTNKYYYYMYEKFGGGETNIRFTLTEENKKYIDIINKLSSIKIEKKLKGEVRSNPETLAHIKTCSFINDYIYCFGIIESNIPPKYLLISVYDGYETIDDNCERIYELEMENAQLKEQIKKLIAK